MKPVAATVTYHDACHLAHAQKVTGAPRRLLSKIPGITLVPLPESDLCCGAAGTYNLTQPQMARDLADRKLNEIAKTGAQIVAAGNAGCRPASGGPGTRSRHNNSHRSPRRIASSGGLRIIMKHTSKSPRETEKIASELARQFRGGECVALYGHLGAGKTQFVRGLARHGGERQTRQQPDLRPSQRLRRKKTQDFSSRRLSNQRRRGFRGDRIFGIA